MLSQELEDKLSELIGKEIEVAAKKEAEESFVDALLCDEDWGEETITRVLKNLRDRARGRKSLDVLILYLFGELIKEGKISITVSNEYEKDIELKSSESIGIDQSEHYYAVGQTLSIGGGINVQIDVK